MDTPKVIDLKSIFAKIPEDQKEYLRSLLRQSKLGEQYLALAEAYPNQWAAVHDDEIIIALTREALGQKIGENASEWTVVFLKVKLIGNSLAAA